MNDQRPLDGRTIVVTRAAAQAQRFTALLEAAGARVLEAPAIVIAPPPSWEPLDTALDALETFTLGDLHVRERRGHGRSPAAAARADVGGAGAAGGWRPSDRPPPTRSPSTACGPTWCPREYRAEGLVERLRARRRRRPIACSCRAPPRRATCS